jgi:DNA-binding response OmpR family regulator
MTQPIKILIVDDDPDVLSAIARVVQKAGYTVIQASTGGEAVKIARKEKPDLILLDVVLPDIMGTAICRRIKADPFFDGMFVILTSGVKTASHHQTEGLDTGADGYIARPVSNQELIARVNAMVRILMGERDRLQKNVTKKISHWMCFLKNRNTTRNIWSMPSWKILKKRFCLILNG